MKDENTAKPQRVGGFELRVIGDYQFDEVASALQKMIRRNQEYEACYWAMILHKSGYYKYIWKRLAVIASEDIGNANPLAPILVQALKQSYDLAIDSKTRQSGDALLFIFQAITYLSRSVKTREADNLVCLLSDQFTAGLHLDIPEVAIDPHTAAGKEKHGRWHTGTPEESKARFERWHSEWAYITPKSDEPDRYLKSLQKLQGGQQ